MRSCKWICAGIAFALCLAAHAAPSDPPLARYSDSLSDDSGSGNDAEAVGPVELEPGLKGEAVSFDGETSLAEIPADLTPSAHPAQTWMAWIRPAALDGRRQIISLDNGGYDRSLLIEDGQLAVFYEAGCSVITSLRENRWQHVAAVFLEGEICIYKDGIEVAKLKEYPQEEGDNYAIAHLGGSPNRMEYFQGLMDEVVILPFALASSGVKLAYGELAPIAHAANGQLAEDESKSGEDGIFSLDSGISNQQPDEGEAAESFARQKIDAEPAGPVEDQAYSTDLAASELSTSSAAKDTNSGDQPSISYSLDGPFSKLLHLTLLGEDPKQVAEILQKERWDNPVALQRTEFSLPDSVDEDGKSWRGARLLDFRGHPVLILFYTGGHPDSDQVKALELIGKLAEHPLAKKEQLECVVVTPFHADAIKADFEKRGIRIKILHDPLDNIRRQMGLYSTPFVLLDKEGRLVWKNRVGQRTPKPKRDGEYRFDSGNLDTVLEMLLSGKIQYANPTPPMTRAKPSESILFDFEDGLGSWQFWGSAWGEAGLSSEKNHPGLVKGYHGSRWLSSFSGDGINGTGLAVSPEFTVTKRYLHFTLGGGDLEQWTGVALVCDGTTAQIATGANTFEMKPVTWDLQKHLGKKARIIAYDAGSLEQRDGIIVDAFIASDSNALPKAFADLHDPNNPEHAERVAKDLPPEWKAIQNGDFHISVSPGRTFRLEWMYQVQPTVKSLSGFRMDFEAYPDTIAQTIHQQLFEIRDSKRGFPSRAESSDKVMVRQVLVAEVRPGDHKETEFPVRHQMLATANILRLENGAPCDFQPLPEKSVRCLTRSNDKLDPLNHPEIQSAVAREGLQRWSGESEPAYLLRCWRWLQRYWTGYDVWGGWPIENSKAPSVVQEWDRKSLDCPAVTALTLLMKNAGIPAIDGQGLWANEDGNICIPHMRSLIFLDRIGWIHLDDHKQLGAPLGPFTSGNNWGDNYFQALNDSSPNYEKPRQNELTTAPNNALGNTWWRSWKGVSPEIRRD